MYQAADNPAQSGMDTPNPTPEDEHVPEEHHLAELTGMTADAARTYLEFHTGMRWLRRQVDA